MLPPRFRRPLPCLRLLAAAAVAGWLLPAWPAQADCAPDPATAGDTVTCTAADADGFDAGVEDNLTVTVEAGATVDNNDVAGTSAIRVNDTNVITVEATGSVTADGMASHGIEGGATNTVTNEGTITVTGSNAAGIVLGDTAIVTNATTGRINTTGTDAVGIQLGNGGKLNNAGVIAGGVLPTPAAGTVGIRIGNMTTEIDNPDPMLPDLSLNAGTITLFGDNSIGIDAVDTNTFTSSGAVSATGTGAIGVRLGMGNDFTNSGSIVINGDASRGVVSNGANMILNLNNLDVSGTNSLAILGSASAERVDNQGRIEGNIDLADGADRLLLYTGSTLIAPNSVLGGMDASVDSLELLGSGSGFLDLDPMLDFETLTIDGGGLWTLSGAAAFSSGATLQNGTIALVDTVTLTGDYVQADATGLLVQYTPGGVTNFLNVGGSATLGMNTTLSLFQTSPILVDTTITVLSTSGGGTLTGTFANIPADTGVLSFTLIDSPGVDGRIDLSITRSSYESLAGTPNQEAVGEYLDEVLLSSPSADVNAALITLDGLSADQLGDAYDQLHPEAYDAHTGAMAAVGLALASVAARERLWCKPPLSELRPGRYQEVPCGRTGYSIWMEAITGVHDRDTGADWFESDGSTQAILGGVDFRPDRRVVVNLWAGLSSVDLHVDGVGDGDFDSYELGISTVARVAGARARAALGYGRGNHEQDREIGFLEFDPVTQGEYDSNRVLGLLELGWALERAGLRLEPLAALDVIWIQEEKFSESGAGDLDLDVEERSNTLVSTAFGARASYRHVQRAYVDPGPSWTQGVWTPEISGRWRSTWSGADREIEANLQGVPDDVGGFTSEARDTEQGAEVSARLTFQPHGGGGAFSIGYDGYFGDGGTSHRFGANLKLHF